MPLGNHYDDHDANNEEEDYCDEEQGMETNFDTFDATQNYLFKKKKESPAGSPLLSALLFD